MTNIALVKASHMAELRSRAGKIYSGSLMRGTAKSHTRDLGQGGVKNWGCECDQQAAGATGAYPTFWL